MIKTTKLNYDETNNTKEQFLTGLRISDDTKCNDQFVPNLTPYTCSPDHHLTTPYPLATVATLTADTVI